MKCVGLFTIFNFDPKFIKKRAVALEKYLRGILADKLIGESGYVFHLSFLSVLTLIQFQTFVRPQGNEASDAFHLLCAATEHGYAC